MQDDIREQFAAAKRLIRSGQVNAGRILLADIDHPKAKEWLAILPEAAVGPIMPRSRAIGMMIVIALVTAMIAGGLGFTMGRESVRAEVEAALRDIGGSGSTGREFSDEDATEIYLTNDAIQTLIAGTEAAGGS
jgi:hypothetical protein